MSTQENQVQTHIEIQIDNRNRQTVFFRWILAAPVVVFAWGFTQAVHWGITTSVIVVPVVLALLVRGVYPSYALTYNHAITELLTRIGAYVFLLTDDYPSIERNPKVAVIFPDVEGGKKLSRVLPLVKWIFAIPLVIVGLLYSVLAVLATIFAWIITSATGTYPAAAIEIVYGTLRYWNRVYGYAVGLVTDEYPSFTL
ncbi:MAG: hypothetical protein RL414_415 [Actinomycetota bacterium]|jgi:hypothetical protein